jgi:myo-inositol-1(or 4)-monophosphatase
VVDLDGLLGLAVGVASEAGVLLLSRRPGDAMEIDTKSSPTDVVTAMDTASEQLIVRRLQEARPDDGVLGEEGGGVPGRSGVRWIIDPIDGTVNYLYGIPEYSVSIAAEVDGTVQVAVVHDPAKAVTYSAIRAGGAFQDRRLLACSRQTSLAQALVATGFGYAATRRARQAVVLREVLPRVRDIRRMGAASLDLCAVATGRVDAFYERGLSPWDLAAGQLIAEEAGATVAGLRGRPAGGDLVIAAGPELFPSLHDLLARCEADRD